MVAVRCEESLEACVHSRAWEQEDVVQVRLYQ